MPASMTLFAGAVWPGGRVEAEKAYSEADYAMVWVPETEIPGSTTDYEIICALDVSQIKAIVIKATVDMTLETNSPSSPANTIPLKANVPYVWSPDQYWSNLLTVDVTKLYLTNGGATAGKFELVALYDNHP